MTRATFQKQEERVGLDHRWEVGSWRMPTQRAPADRVDGAPAWWHGEEEASAAFLREVGVELT
jgi:hypothetical protein